MAKRHFAFWLAISLAAPSTSVAQEGRKPVTPKGDMGGWFPMDVYPAEAKRRGEQGRVVVQLTVDKTGNATACRVVESSGSASLDARTCELARANGRFSPARDAAGKPIETTYTLPAVRWELKDDFVNLYLDGGPVTSTRAIEVMVDAEGKGVSCQPVASTSGATTGCEAFRPGVTITPPLLLNGKPIAGKVTITTTTRVEPK